VCGGAVAVLVLVCEGAGTLDAKFGFFLQKYAVHTIPDFFSDGVLFSNKFA
jgi:hypothetical protein